MGEQSRPGFSNGNRFNIEVNPEDVRANSLNSKGQMRSSKNGGMRRNINGPILSSAKEDERNYDPINHQYRATKRQGRRGMKNGDHSLPNMYNHPNTDSELEFQSASLNLKHHSPDAYYPSQFERGINHLDLDQ